jgi:hypothetical protein
MPSSHTAIMLAASPTFTQELDFLTDLFEMEMQKNK